MKIDVLTYDAEGEKEFADEFSATLGSEDLHHRFYVDVFIMPVTKKLVSMNFVVKTGNNYVATALRIPDKFPANYRTSHGVLRITRN